MTQAGHQGSEGDEEDDREEHVGAAEWTGASLGRGQPTTSRDLGTVPVDLLETFENKQTCKTPLVML